VTRSAWESVQGMDPAFYPVWFEDVDFCKRLIDSGHKIVYCPTARFRHSGAHSVGSLSFTEKQVFWYRNMLRYAGKHFSFGKVWILRIAIVAGILFRLAAVLAERGPEHVSAREASETYRKVIRLALSL